MKYEVDEKLLQSIADCIVASHRQAFAIIDELRALQPIEEPKEPDKEN